MTAAVAVAVMLATLAAIIVRPRGLNEGVAALIGAAVVLVFRLVPPEVALRAEWDNWNVFLFFLGMMAIAALADQSSVFDVVAARAAEFARCRVTFLYLAVFALGTTISLLFANDSAALVLTPIVYAIVVRLALDPLPFVFATTFIADTASVGLPVSNPLNVILAASFHLGLGAYVSHLWLPAILVVLVNVAVFFIVFRRTVTGRFQASLHPGPAPGLRSTSVILALLAIAYLAASALQFPLGLVALAGAAALAVNLWRLSALDLRRVARDVGWPIFGFIGGMLVVVRALQESGVTASLGHGLVVASGTSSLQTILVGTIGTAIGSNLINNLPMALVMTSTIHPLHLAAHVKLDMVYATILGCDLGPNLTHLGSLATFIWLFFLRRKGLDVSTLDYVKVGIVVTPAMLVVGAFGLWLAG